MKAGYWISTSLLCLLMLFSAQMYIFSHDDAVWFYEHLGFPTWWIYPSAALKILAVVAILTKFSRFLKEWAYAGIFFDVCLAFVAHHMANDPLPIFSIGGILFVIVSYILDGKVYGNALLPIKPSS